MVLKSSITLCFVYLSIQIPEECEEEEPSSSYTGMAAALAEALKQRRLHVADKSMFHVELEIMTITNFSLHAGQSLGELDESNMSNEWQSP